MKPPVLPYYLFHFPIPLLRQLCPTVGLRSTRLSMFVYRKPERSIRIQSPNLYTVLNSPPRAFHIEMKEPVVLWQNGES